MIVPLEKPGTPTELVHHGTKGMKWGVRKPTSSSSGGGGSNVRGAAKLLDNAAFTVGSKTHFMERKVANQAAKGLRKDLPGIKAKHGAYGKMRNRAKHPFSPEAKAYRTDVKKAYLKRLESSANSMTNVQGNRRYTLKDDDGTPNTSQYFWNLNVEYLQHADNQLGLRVRPIFDDEGYIVDIEVVDDDMKQTAELGAKFLKHMGVDI